MAARRPPDQDGRVHGRALTLIVAAAIAALCLVPTAVSAKTRPGAVVNITFSGQSTGHQALAFPGADADPDTGCPALPQSGYTIDSTVHWNATYKGVLLSLAKATGALSSRKV